jgi:hypothetical protein
VCGGTVNPPHALEYCIIIIIIIIIIYIVVDMYV